MVSIAASLERLASTFPRLGHWSSPVAPILASALIVLSCGAKRAAPKPNPYATETFKGRPRDATCYVCEPVKPLEKCGALALTPFTTPKLSEMLDQVVSVQGYPITAANGCTEVSCACCNDCDGIMGLVATRPQPRFQRDAPPMPLIVLEDHRCHGDDNSSCCGVPPGAPLVAIGVLEMLEGYPNLPGAFAMHGASYCAP